MQEKTVKDYMIALSEYAVVSEEATLAEAILALEKAQTEFDRSRYRHRAILIQDENGKIVGKLAQQDILRALEPKYRNLEQDESLSRFGLNPELMKSILTQYSLWDRPLSHLCGKAAYLKVRDIMYTPSDGDLVDEKASLEQAIHQIIVADRQSLLVVRDGEIVGILRLSDLFALVCDELKNCTTG